MIELSLSLCQFDANSIHFSWKSLIPILSLNSDEHTFLIQSNCWNIQPPTIFHSFKLTFHFPENPMNIEYFWFALQHCTFQKLRFSTRKKWLIKLNSTCTLPQNNDSNSVWMIFEFESEYRCKSRYSVEFVFFLLLTLAHEHADHNNRCKKHEPDWFVRVDWSCLQTTLYRIRWCF